MIARELLAKTAVPFAPGRARNLWRACVVVCGAGTALFFAAMAYTMTAGIGTWGNNIPVAWSFAITSFVWWIGIGHAGTFISAILLLLRQRWRTSISRVAEAMTLFAVANAALFPLLHLGRPWFAYWLAPIPLEMQTWPQFRSPLTWDMGAVATYGTVSVLFFYVGLLPDLAKVRDNLALGVRARRVYGVLALGWRNTRAHWTLHRRTVTLLAGLATPLVVSVHTLVSFDFAVSFLHGWHSTLFPPYFVAGALFSGFAMLALLLVPIRAAFKLHDVIHARHFDAVGKMMLALSLVLAYSYGVEHVLAATGDDAAERLLALRDRPFGPYAVCVWATLLCNCVAPQVLWSPRARRSPLVLFVVAAAVNVGMWLERFVIIAGSLSRSFLASSWGTFVPSFVDVALLVGSLSFFGLLVSLLVRFVPFVPIADLQEERASRHG